MSPLRPLTTGRSFYCKNMTAIVNASVWPYLVLVFRAVWVVRLQGGELAALGAGLRAGVQLTQFQKVTVLCHLFIGQMGDHQSLLQGATTLCDRTSNESFARPQLGNKHRQMFQHWTEISSRSLFWACYGQKWCQTLLKSVLATAGSWLWVSPIKRLTIGTKSTYGIYSHHRWDLVNNLPKEQKEGEAAEWKAEASSAEWRLMCLKAHRYTLVSPLWAPCSHLQWGELIHRQFKVYQHRLF